MILASLSLNAISITSSKLSIEPGHIYSNRTATNKAFFLTTAYGFNINFYIFSIKAEAFKGHNILFNVFKAIILLYKQLFSKSFYNDATIIILKGES